MRIILYAPALLVWWDFDLTNSGWVPESRGSARIVSSSLYVLLTVPTEHWKRLFGFRFVGMRGVSWGQWDAEDCHSVVSIEDSWGKVIEIRSGIQAWAIQNNGVPSSARHSRKMLQTEAMRSQVLEIFLIIQSQATLAVSWQDYNPRLVSCKASMVWYQRQWTFKSPITPQVSIITSNARMAQGSVIKAARPAFNQISPHDEHQLSVILVFLSEIFVSIRLLLIHISHISHIHVFTSIATFLGSPIVLIRWKSEDIRKLCRSPHLHTSPLGELHKLDFFHILLLYTKVKPSESSNRANTQLWHQKLHWSNG